MELHSAQRNPPETEGGVGALDRAITVFEAVVEAAPDVSLAAVAARTGLPKSTVHRTLAVWTRRGYVVTLGHGRYGPGPRLLAAAGRVSAAQDPARVAHRSLRELQRHTDHTVHLGMLVGREAVYVDKVEGRRPYRMASRVGMSLPLHSTAIGKAILAHLEPAERHELLTGIALSRRTPRTIADADRLRAELDGIQRRGWALDDEENEAGIRCVGAPVFDHRGAAAGAISVSAPSFDFPVSAARRLAPALLACAAAVSIALGGNGSLRPVPQLPVEEGS